MLIKVLLILGVGGAAFHALRTQDATGRALRRVAAVCFALAGALAVLFPGVVTWLAERVGVGRGTDLVLYVMVIAFLFTAIGLYQRVQTLEERITQLTRALALHTTDGHERDVD
jgi:hypothetical protein